MNEVSEDLEKRFKWMNIFNITMLGFFLILSAYNYQGFKVFTLAQRRLMYGICFLQLFFLIVAIFDFYKGSPVLKDNNFGLFIYSISESFLTVAMGVWIGVITWGFIEYFQGELQTPGVILIMNVGVLIIAWKNVHILSSDFLKN